MKILVTGAAGMLGGVVCRHLVDAGHDVVAADRRYDRSGAAPMRIVDLLDAPAVYRLAEGCEAVVHLANHTGGRVPPERLYSENTAMNANVFQAAADLGASSLVYASSVQVFAGDRRGDQPDRPSCLPYLPLDGFVPPHPRNPYAASKEAGEALLRYHSRRRPEMACTALRWPLLAHEARMAHFRANQPAEAPNPRGMLDVGFTYLALPDAAELIASVIQRQGPGYHPYLPASPANRLGWDVPRIVAQFYPRVPLSRPVEQLTGLVDLSDLAEELDWRPRHSALS